MNPASCHHGGCNVPTGAALFSATAGGNLPFLSTSSTVPASKGNTGEDPPMSPFYPVYTKASDKLIDTQRMMGRSWAQAVPSVLQGLPGPPTPATSSTDFCRALSRSWQNRGHCSCRNTQDTLLGKDFHGWAHVAPQTTEQAAQEWPHHSHYLFQAEQDTANWGAEGH